MRQIVELVKAFVFSEVIIQSQHITLIIGDEVFLIAFSVYANPGEQGLHFLNGSGKSQVFSDFNAPFRVHPQIGHIGFKHHGGPAG